MTLKEYYESLPEPTCPKTDFARLVAEKCGVSFYTAKNWLKTKIRPNNPEHLDILSSLTGIPKEELWNDNNK